MSQPSPQEPWPGWGQALYTGAAGIALAHIEYAHTGTAGWDTAHRWAAAMLRSPVTAHPDTCALDRGAPAVAFTLHAAARPGYAPTLAILDRHITAATRHRLQWAHQRIDAGRLPALREYDLIRGLTGIGAYLLHRHGGGDPLHQEVLKNVLSYLVRLTEPLTIGGEAVPGWWTGNAPDDQPSPRWPGGHGNLGMAHGIAGPLTLLSTAMRQGATVAGQPDAIGRICAWLDQWRTGFGTQAWWPETVSPRPSCAPAPSARPVRAGRPGATAPPAWPAPSNSPPSPWPTRAGNGSPSRPWPAASPTTTSSPTSPTPRCATAGPASCTPPGGSRPTPATRNSSPCRSCFNAPNDSCTNTGHQPTTGCSTVWQAWTWPATPSPWVSRRAAGGTPACCSTADPPHHLPSNVDRPSPPVPRR